MARHAFEEEWAIEFGTDEAIAIESFVFWIKKNRSNERNAEKQPHFRDGRWWSYNSIESFHEDWPYWSPWQIRRILQSLVKKGVLRTAQYGGSVRTIWYAFNDEKRFLGEPKTHPAASPKASNPNLANTKMEVGKRQDAIRQTPTCNTKGAVPNTVANTAAATRAREESASDPLPSATSEPVAAAADPDRPSESDPMTALLESVGISDPLIVAELSTGRSLEEMRYRVEDVRKRSTTSPAALLIHTIRHHDPPPDTYLRWQKREHAAANREVVAAAARRAAPPGEADPTAYESARSPIGRDERPARAAPEVEEEWRLQKARLKAGCERSERERMAGEEAARAKALRLAQQAAGMAA